MTEEKKTFICLKDAIRVVYKTKHMVDLTDSMKSLVVAKDAIVLGLKKLPTIEEPKTGHWIYIGNSCVNGLKICKCDVCGKSTFGSHEFCPNCGCRMESEE